MAPISPLLSNLTTGAITAKDTVVNKKKKPVSSVINTAQNATTTAPSPKPLDTLVKGATSAMNTVQTNNQNLAKKSLSGLTNIVKDTTNQAEQRVENKKELFDSTVTDVRDDAVNKQNIADAKVLDIMQDYTIPRKELFDLGSITRKKLEEEGADIEGLDDIDIARFVLETSPPEEIQKFKREGVVGSLVGAGRETQEKQNQALAREASGQQGNLSTGLQNFGSVAGYGTDVIGDAVGGILKGTGKIANYITNGGAGELATNIGEKIKGTPFYNEQVQGALDALSNGVENYEEFKRNNPEAGANLDSVLSILDLGSNLVGGAIVGKQVAKSVAKSGAKEAIEQGTKKGIKSVKNIITKRGLIAEERNIEKTTKRVLKQIQEGNTAADKKLALKEGRLVPEKEAGFFRSGNESYVKASKKSEEAAKTIAENIPNPSKNNSMLYQQGEDTIKKIATDLSSDFKKIPINKTDPIVSKISDSFEELSSLTDEFTKSDIKKFDKVLSDMNTRETVDDAIKTRKGRDDMFSDAIKNATDDSAPSTRKAHRIWMEGRTTLNDTIDKVAKNYGDDTFRSKLKTQSNIYHALGNMVKRAPEKGKSIKKLSTIRRNLPGLTKTAGSIGLGALGYKVFGG